MLKRAVWSSGILCGTLIVASSLPAAAQAPAGPTFTVNSTADAAVGDLVGGQPVDCTAAGQPCTLRAAVAQGGGTINLPAGNYALTSYGTGDGVLFFAGHDAAIVGAGAGATTITNSSGQRAVFVRDHSLSVSGVSIATTNDGFQTGGAFGVYLFGTLVVTNSVIAGNDSGAILNQGTATFTNCAFHDNVGFSAIINTATLNVAGSTFTNNANDEDGGGAIVSGGRAIISSSTFSGNTAFGGTLGGGAILNSEAYGNIVVMDIVNSTITNNLDIDSPGNAAIVSDNVLRITNSTITANNPSGVARLYGSIQIKNSVVVGGVNRYACNSSGILDAGYNIISESSCGTVAPTTLVGIDPKLGPLADNGGPTQTMAIGLDSPALDAIPAASCVDFDGNPVSADQRGITRPQGQGCDIGAYELIATPGETPAGSNVAVQPNDTTTGSPAPISLTFSNVTDGGTTTVTSSVSGPPPPTGFKLGSPPIYYEITTTASFTGVVQVCISYSGTASRLKHFTGGVWVDITTSNDTVAHVICGNTASFSPFAVFDTQYVATAQPPIAASGSTVFAANRGTIPVKFTVTFAGAATCQLPPASIVVARIAGPAPGPVNEASYLAPSDDGSSFRISSCQYVYNLAAGSLGAGTYVAQIVIGGAPAGGAIFALR